MGSVAQALARSAMSVLVLTTIGCGSGDGSSGPANKGGSITIATSSQPDALDPALSDTPEAWEAMWLVYTPPLTYRRAEGKDGTELIPGVARALPEISPDGKTYEFELRAGLKYSDGSAVRAGDFEHTVKRVLNFEAGVRFFDGIVGAGEYLKGADPEQDIRGIEADDRTGRVTIELAEPDATFSNALASNFAGLVPRDTPFEDQTEDPPPGVGPYAITKSVPNREYVMEQVAGFELPDIPEGNVQQITTRIVASPTRQARDVINGELDYMQDPVPVELLPEIRSKYKDRYREFPTLSTYFFFLNRRVPPFGDKQVRQAVNVALDSTALARLFSNRLEPSCNYLPSSLVGFDAVDPCPFGDPGGSGNPERARQMVEDAGAEGQRVTVYTDGDANRPEIGALYTDLLNKIGLRAKRKTLDGEVLRSVIGSASTSVQTGFASLPGDVPHPAHYVSLADDPELNDEIAQLRQEADLAAVAGRWAVVDRKLIEESYLAPLGSQKLATFLSERMDFENCSLFHPLYHNDYSSFCLS